MNESELLNHIQSRASGLAAALTGGWSVIVGPGDDCAVLNAADGSSMLVTVDQLVEGVHFKPGTDLSLIARKAVARSVSDIAAMGGTPSWSTATGLMPKGFTHGKELIDELNRWAGELAGGWGCPLIGGDLAFHSDADHPLTLTVTVAGVMEQGHQPVLRSGASAGDRVYVTGPLGGSFEKQSGLGRHLTFEPRLEAGRWASSINSEGRTNASAMIDLSDGLGRDAARVAKGSGVLIELKSSAIPCHEGVANWRAALSDGEDYELMMTIPEGVTIPESVGLTGPIGVCCALTEGDSPSCIVIDNEVHRHDASSLGWDHSSVKDPL